MTKLLQASNDMTAASVGFDWKIIGGYYFGFKIRLTRGFGFLGQKTYREKNISLVRVSDTEFDDDLNSSIFWGAATGGIIGTAFGSTISGVAGGILGGYLTGRKKYPKSIFCHVEFDDKVSVRLKVTGVANVKKMIELAHSTK